MIHNFRIFALIAKRFVNLKTELDSLSPLSFQSLKVGDLLSLKKQLPRKNEFRQSIGKPTESTLVFKGVMKVGMLPIRFVVEQESGLTHKRICRVLEIDADTKKIIVEIL